MNLNKLFFALPMLAAACAPAGQNAPAESPREWAKNAVIYEVNIRQYTPEGTFNAFAEHLPRLSELGADVLWLMPVYPISEVNRKGTLGSYYAIADYKGVNPAFGSPADLKRLIEKAHSMGMKVMLDWVANHTGCDNVWLAQHPEWFVTDSTGAFLSPYDWTDVYELNYDNAQMRAAMIDAMQYWIREFDVDGFRCDVAYEVPTDFWEEARPQLDSIKPMFMLAEAEHADLMNSAFDICYNWPLKNLMADVAKGSKTAADIDTLLCQQQATFPQGALFMNHITNHDLNSWEGTEFDRLGNGVKAFAVLTYTVPGMPLLYTAQETGLNRAIQFFEKDPVESWERNEWFGFYSVLNALKRNNPALDTYGVWSDVERIDLGNANVLAYRRSAGESAVVVVLNLSAEAQAIDGAKVNIEGCADVFGDLTAVPSTLEPWQYCVFAK